MDLQRTAFHSLRLILAIIMIGFSLTAGTEQAQANCCRVTIDNLSSCTFEICIITNNSIQCVQINSGTNHVSLPTCPDVRVVIKDACGVTHTFPTTTCINVLLSSACCLKICPSPDAPCRWVITNSPVCAPCHS